MVLEDGWQWSQTQLFRACSYFESAGVQGVSCYSTTPHSPTHTCSYSYLFSWGSTGPSQHPPPQVASVMATLLRLVIRSHRHQQLREGRNKSKDNLNSLLTCLCSCAQMPVGFLVKEISERLNPHILRVSGVSKTSRNCKSEVSPQNLYHPFENKIWFWLISLLRTWLCLLNIFSL